MLGQTFSLTKPHFLCSIWWDFSPLLLNVKVHDALTRTYLLRHAQYVIATKTKPHKNSLRMQDLCHAGCTLPKWTGARAGTPRIYGWGPWAPLPWATSGSGSSAADCAPCGRPGTSPRLPGGTRGKLRGVWWDAPGDDSESAWSGLEWRYSLRRVQISPYGKYAYNSLPLNVAPAPSRLFGRLNAFVAAASTSPDEYIEYKVLYAKKSTRSDDGVVFLQSSALARSQQALRWADALRRAASFSLPSCLHLQLALIGRSSASRFSAASDDKFSASCASAETTGTRDGSVVTPKVDSYGFWGIGVGMSDVGTEAPLFSVDAAVRPDQRSHFAVLLRYLPRLFSNDQWFVGSVVGAFFTSEKALKLGPIDASSDLIRDSTSVKYEHWPSNVYTCTYYKSTFLHQY